MWSFLSSTLQILQNLRCKRFKNYQRTYLQLLIFDLLLPLSFQTGTSTPESLTVDGKRLYWTTADDLIASVDKSAYDDFQSQPGDAMFVIAFGDNLQPFPGKIYRYNSAPQSKNGLCAL